MEESELVESRMNINEGNGENTDAKANKPAEFSKNSSKHTKDGSSVKSPG
jgi:hypothetical protein